MKDEKFVFSRGFTLIELIVVFSIIAILSMVGIAAFVNYSRVQALNTATSELVTMLQTARSRAQSQVKPGTGICVGQPLVGYEVHICRVSLSTTPPFAYTSTGACGPSSSEYDYELTANCGGNIHFIEGKKLPTNIAISSVYPLDSSGKASVLFSVLTGGANVHLQIGRGIRVWGYGQPRYVYVCPGKNLGVTPYGLFFACR